MTIKHLILLVCVITIGQIDSARILAYITTPSISHQLFFRSLTQELVKRGHEVVVITTNPAFPKGEAPAYLTEIDLHDLSGPLWKKFQNASKGRKSDLISHMSLAMATLSGLFYKQVNTSEVKNVLYGPKFDLLLLEAWSKPLIAISHVQKAPVILISSFGTTFYLSEAMGAPTHPILYPSATSLKLYNLTIWEKISELFNRYMLVYLLHKGEEYHDNMFQKHFGPDLPPFRELMNNVDMLFLNMHPIFEGNFPVPPGMVNVWGIYRNNKPEDLPEDLKIFLDSSKHGVIYMSFGTNTDPSLLPPEKIQMFVNVFCRLPYDVLWKWNKDELPGRCKNIKIGKWFPQPNLLSHPNIKAFVTQGGMQSTDEATKVGIPLVGIPMMADQWFNVEKYVHLNIGVQLDIVELTEEMFKNAVTTVIEDKSYRQNIKKLDELMSDQPAPALERAVWWVEHVLRHGGARHLRAPAANISWGHYYEIELLAVLLSGLLIAVIVVLLCLFSIVSLFKSKVKTN